MYQTPLRRLLLATIALVTFSVEPGYATVITDGCSVANQSCTLSELVAGGSIVIDDKRCDDWSIRYDDSTTAANPNLIKVTPLDDQILNPGLQFDANGEFSVVGFDAIDIALGFRVSTLDGSARIKDNSLEINAFAFGANNLGGFIQIFEDVLDANGDLIGEKFVTADNFPPPLLDLFDSAQFSPQPEIFAQKSIFLSGDDLGDTVSLDRFTQRFSQVPEPPALFLVGMGSAGLGLSKQRKA